MDDFDAHEVGPLASCDLATIIEVVNLSTAQGNEELRNAIAEVTPGLLVSAVDEMLIIQRGKELGYKVSNSNTSKSSTT